MRNIGLIFIQFALGTGCEAQREETNHYWQIQEAYGAYRWSVPLSKTPQTPRWATASYVALFDTIQLDVMQLLVVTRDCAQTFLRRTCCPVCSLWTSERSAGDIIGLRSVTHVLNEA